MLCSIRPSSRYKKGRPWATFPGTSFCDHPLFVQISGHVYAVVGVGLGNFVLSALLLSLCGDFGFCTVQRARGDGDALREAGC